MSSGLRRCCVSRGLAPRALAAAGDAPYLRARLPGPDARSARRYRSLALWRERGNVRTRRSRFVRRDAGIAAARAERCLAVAHLLDPLRRSEEHTSELQSLMRISYAVFCLNKKSPIHSYICTTR